MAKTCSQPHPCPPWCCSKEQGDSERKKKKNSGLKLLVAKPGFPVKSIPRWRCQNLPAAAPFWKGQIPRLHIWPSFRRCVPKAFKKKTNSLCSSSRGCRGVRAAPCSVSGQTRLRVPPWSVPGAPSMGECWGLWGGWVVGARCCRRVQKASKNQARGATKRAGGGASVQNWSLRKTRVGENFLRAEATALTYQLLTS